MSYIALKHLHVTCVVLSGLGFAVRFFWVLTESRLARVRMTRILPHVIDTALLCSALAMVWLSGQYPFVHAWLTAKVLALLVYIGLGAMALKAGRTSVSRLKFGLLAALAFAYA